METVEEAAQNLIMLLKTFAMYRMSIRNAVRALWNGTWNWYEFFEGMDTNIRNQFPAAWREGMRMAGLNPDDMTPEERIRLNQEIAREVSYVGRFADAIERGSRANGGRLEPLFRRADLWAAGYNRIRDLALTYAKNDPVLLWQLGVSEHCPSCRRLDQKKKRASFWKEQGVYPRAWDKLQCRSNCKCALIPTTGPVTPGPLPHLP